MRSNFATATKVTLEIEADVKTLSLFPKQTYYLRNKILKLYNDYRKTKINFNRNKSVQTLQILRFREHLKDHFPCTQQYERSTNVRKPTIPANNDEVENTYDEIENINDDEVKDPSWIYAETKISSFLFISPNVCQLLDRLGISSNSMARVFVELKRANNLKGSTSVPYILKKRNDERENAYQRLLKFDYPNSLILHWDGKRMKNNKDEMVERLIISISAPNGLQKLISCNFIDDGTGKSIETLETTMVTA